MQALREPAILSVYSLGCSYYNRPAFLRRGSSSSGWAEPAFSFRWFRLRKIKVRFGQTFVIAQIEKVPSIDAGFPQLEACHVQKVANIERDLQTMDILVLVGGDEQQASVYQILFIQWRTGKNDGQCFFFRHS